MRRLDITGDRYGKLTALKRLPNVGQSRWIFRCDCGNETEALQCNVRSGQVLSCGCAGSRTTIGQRAFKHGHGVGYKKSRTATAWRNAKTRCFNQANAKYPQYGGRGITMCKRWSDDFRAFLLDMGECPDGLTLERIDVNGNYEPGNCEWIPAALQAKNRTSNVIVDGMTLTDYAQKHGVPYKMLCYRLKRGETAHQATAWLLARLAKRRTPARSNKCDQTS